MYSNDTITIATITNNENQNDIITSINTNQHTFDTNNTILTNSVDTVTVTHISENYIDDCCMNSSNDYLITDCSMIAADVCWTVTSTPQIDEEFFISNFHIESMCEEYPALKKAYKNFKTIYDLVKEDYAIKNRK